MNFKKYLLETGYEYSSFEKALDLINSKDFYYEKEYKDGFFKIKLEKYEEAFKLDNSRFKDKNININPISVYSWIKSDYKDQFDNYYEVKYDIKEGSRFLTWNFDIKTDDEFIKKEIKKVIPNLLDRLLTKSDNKEVSINKLRIIYVSNHENSKGLKEIRVIPMTKSNLDLYFIKIGLGIDQYLKNEIKRAEVGVRLKNDALSFKFGRYMWNDKRREISIDKSSESGFVTESIANFITLSR